MNTNVVISLDTRRAKSDGTYPLIMRLGHNKRTTSLPLDINLSKKDWNEERRIIRDSYKGSESVTRLNNKIQKKKAEALDIIHKLDENGQLENISLTDLRNMIASQSSSVSFFTFSNKIVADLKAANRIGTARSYQGVLDVLTDYRNEQDLTFNQITFTFLKSFENHHIGKGNNYNGLAVYMRTIRALYNLAIKSGIAEKEKYPFNDYKITTVPTKKRALDWELLMKIIQKDISEAHPCYNTRNYFLASYLMYGMNFIDMAFLKKENIASGRIAYERSKTGKHYDIKITANLDKILSHYLNTRDSEYVFPIIKRQELSLQYKDIDWARKRYNKKLKELAKYCDVDQHLTSYVSRHSFATQAMLQEVPVNAISAMLGHSSIKTTQVYLKSLPSNIIDEYNMRIAGKMTI